MQLAGLGSEDQYSTLYIRHFLVEKLAGTMQLAP